jgi:hypothetical protein
MENGNGSHTQTAQAAAAVQRSAYDRAGRAVSDAAAAHKAEKDALAKGDTAAATAAHEQAMAADSKARSALEAARIKSSDSEAMITVAGEMSDAGDHGNPITKYLDTNPEAASGALDAEQLGELHGGQEIADAMAEDAALRAGAATTTTAQAQAGAASNQSTQQALAQLQQEIPANSSAGQKLSKAAGLLHQALDLRNKAIATMLGIQAAERELAEGRSDEGQFGVQRRNMETQNNIMRGLTRLLGGGRPDVQLRENANREARESQLEVVRLMRDFVDRDSSSIARRGHTDRV